MGRKKGRGGKGKRKEMVRRRRKRKRNGEEKEEREVPFLSGPTSTDSSMAREPGASSASWLLLLLWGLSPSTEGEGRE